MKLSHAIDGFFLEKQLNLSKTTIARYRLFLGYLVDHCQDMELEAIRADDIRLLLAWLQKERNYSKRSLYDFRGVLSSFWSWAEKELDVPHIIRGIEKPKYTDKVIVGFTRDEIKRLVRAAQFSKGWVQKGKKTQSKRPTAARDKAIILTLLDTGVRVSELCAFAARDYNNHLGRLHIRHGKGDKERYVPVGVQAQKAIWRYMATRPEAKPGEPLFSVRSGYPMDRNNVRNLLATIGKNAQVANVHPHRFRHTFAIEFLRNGGNVFALKEILGHADLKSVLIYLELADKDIDAARRHSPADNWGL